MKRKRVVALAITAVTFLVLLEVGLHLLVLPNPKIVWRPVPPFGALTGSTRLTLGWSAAWSAAGGSTTTANSPSLSSTSEPTGKTPRTPANAFSSSGSNCDAARSCMRSSPNWLVSGSSS